MYKEYASKQFVEEYFKNQNISSVSTPDWNENDENSSSYIKNRTHWEEVSWEEVLPLTTVDGFTAVGENGVYSAYYEMPALDNNSFYSIKFDGVEYFGLGGSLMSSNVANGNAPTTENEAPFCFVEEYLGAGTYDYYVYVYADGESHTFDILKHVGDIHKIDKKFLPTLIGSKTYNNGEIFNNAMNASYYAHAEGFETIASGNSSHAEGYSSTASGDHSHSEGWSTEASGDSSHAEGWSTEASGDSSHAEGYGSTASGNGSHAEGGETIASGGDSHAEGYRTVASGSYSHAECGGNSAPAMTFSSAYYPIIGSNDIEISNTTAYGESSHAEGGNTFAYGEFSHAEGINTGALGECSHAEGEYSIALGKYSHAEGVNVQATGNWSHAEGGNTEASGYSSHAEGFISVASGNYSHAEGRETIASGTETHTEGLKTTASGDHSHAEGWGTIANSDDQHVQGRYNISDSENKYLHIVGNGNQNMDGVRSNAHTLDWEGNAWFAGDVYVGSTSGKNKDEGSKKLVTVDDIAQADWNQNDENASDYIKNRPFYDESISITFDGNIESKENIPQEDTPVTIVKIHDTPINAEKFIGGYYEFIQDGAIHGCDITADSIQSMGTQELIGELIIIVHEAFDYGDGTIVSPGIWTPVFHIGDDYNYVTLLEVNSIKTIDPKYLPDGIGGGADWNQNDESAPDYVKNRFGGYYEKVYDTLLEETELNFSHELVNLEDCDYAYTAYLDESTVVSLWEGGTVRVVFDGVTYEKTYESYGFAPDDSVPFGIFADIIDLGKAFIYTLSDEDSHTVEISKIESTAVPVPEEFLPHSVKVQPDWSVNDETDPAYVKGRTHYSEVSVEEILPLQEIKNTGAEQYSIPYIPEDVHDKTSVTVLYNGVEYDMYAGYSQGLEMYLITGLDVPCEINTYDGASYLVPFVQPTVDTITISVYRKNETVHPLDPKFGGMPTLAEDGSDAGKVVRVNSAGTGFELVAMTNVAEEGA